MRLANGRTGKSRLLAISLAAVFIIMSSSSGSMVRNCLDRSSLTGVHGKSKRPSLREVGLPSVSLPSRSNVAKRLGDSGRMVIRARPRAASKSDRSVNKGQTGLIVRKKTLKAFTQHSRQYTRNIHLIGCRCRSQSPT